MLKLARLKQWIALPYFPNLSKGMGNRHSAVSSASIVHSSSPLTAASAGGSSSSPSSSFVHHQQLIVNASPHPTRREQPSPNDPQYRRPQQQQVIGAAINGYNPYQNYQNGGIALNGCNKALPNGEMNTVFRKVYLAKNLFWDQILIRSKFRMKTVRPTSMKMVTPNKMALHVPKKAGKKTTITIQHHRRCLTKDERRMKRAESPPQNGGLRICLGAKKPRCLLLTMPLPSSRRLIVRKRGIIIPSWFVLYHLSHYQIIIMVMVINRWMVNKFKPTR